MTVFRQTLVILAWALLATSRSTCGADNFAEASLGQDRVITSAYFGIHFHRLVLQPQEDAVRTQWPDLQFGNMRLWDSVTRWGDVSPNAGQWDFSRLDAYMGEAKLHDASVLYTLGSTPRWASTRPDERCPYGTGCAAEPVRFAHWEEYVRRVALRYRGSIAAYELWNEPYFSDVARDRAEPYGFFSGSIANMVELARIARKTLDETSPGTILATPGFVNGVDRLDMFLGAGGKEYVQAVSYHFYSQNADDFIRQVLQVREVMRRHGFENRPLWNTELGVEVYPANTPLPPGVKQRLTRKEAAVRMAQFLVLGAAVGLDRFYYYAWDNTRSGMVTTRGERLPAYEAMSRIQTWLIGSRMRGCVSPDRGVVKCRIESGQQTYLIAWASRSGEQTLMLPEGMQVGAVDMLFSSTALPEYRGRRRSVQITLGPEPVRIMLERQEQP